MACRRVVVLGRGVLGASTSYHLSKLGAEVVCFDAAQLASCATSRSAGLILHAGNAQKAAMASQTLADVRELSSILKDDLHFRQVGTLHIATTPAELDRLQSQMENIGHFSQVNWIEPDRVEKLVPWFSVQKHALGCAWVQRDGFIDPVVLAGAYWEAAKGFGARHIAENVDKLLTSGGSAVVGVRSTNGTEVHVDHVVDATGCWAGSMAERSLDILPLPMAPTRSHYWLAAPSDRFFSKSTPMVICPAARFYSRPEGSCSSFFGLQEAESMTWDCKAIPMGIAANDFAAAEEEQASELLLQGLETMSEFLHPEYLEQISMAHYVAGISTYTADGRYIIGQLAEDVKGYSVASGCNGSGLSSAGGIGKLVAESIVTESEGHLRALQELEQHWSVKRFSFEETHGLPGGVRGETFRRQCSLSRAGKFGQTATMVK